MLDTLLYPLEWFVAAIMVGWHKLFSLVGLPEASGWTWALSIAGLVIVLRILLIPLFVKQIHASRRMQLVQPEMQKIQKKYKGKKDPESRQKQQEEMMELYRTTGTNPMGSCMPILLQAPFFFALFRVLNNLDDIARGDRGPIGFLTKELASQAESSTLLGAKLSSTFMGTSGWGAAKWVAVLLIILMSATSFITQHQLMRRNMPKAALEGPMAKQQQIIIYLMPLFFAISGVNFPIGVLIYWFVTNLWTMFQQWYVIRRMPTPGSDAEKKLEERNRSKGREHKTVTMDDLRKENEGKPKTRFQQAMDRAQEQAKAQQAVKSGATPASAKKDKSVKTADTSTQVSSPVKENVRPAKAQQTGPRNQPKKNTPRAKRKKN
ncbi:membrane protein insertase YidC [Dermacoccus abyssi]|uniref:Membrane protein insertase YidC n=1 Tax=Dermacoccus abyssi TaxID=322596 RepID=A0ABX5ZD17_9MICO|nr:membrane protein insertase YidC [Dermacoccus abyssi]